ncbi:MAG: tetratricopeptide repeat protein, partial [Planctomycetota bacterium]|jgi:thioredoxin-like negative regulator of GroEL
LVELYALQGRQEEAESLLVEILEGHRRVLGEEHPSTLESMRILVELYETWGKAEKAQEWRTKLASKENAEEK